VTHLREKGHHFKAWHYLQMAEAQTKPSVGLFLDPSAYGHKLDYERSILHYYVKADRNEGAMLCLTYEGPNQTLTNLEHYAQKIPHLSKSRLCFPCPSGFVSSSAAIQGDLLCVRCVSYLIAPDGSYLMPSGLVETRNFLATWHGDSWSDWTELLVGESPLRQDIIRGLEDIRLYDNDFTATTREYSYCDRNRIVHGTIEDDRVHFVAVKPPFGETECEKNWLPISGGKVIYSWHPLHIGVVYDGKLEIALSYDTPRWFRHLRGSAPPFEMDGQLWVLTHVVVPTSPRQYYTFGWCWTKLQAGEAQRSVLLPPHRHRILPGDCSDRRRRADVRLNLGSRDLVVRDLQRPFAEKPGVHPGDIIILPLILAASKMKNIPIHGSS